MLLIWREQTRYHMKNQNHWKKLNLQRKDGGVLAANCEETEKGRETGGAEKEAEGAPASTYLIARNDEEEWQKELLYQVLGPVFFGKKEAADERGLAALFRARYGIDVGSDFYEGDEHFEEYQEAQQAIADGMSIYSGAIVFEDSVLAEYAEKIWDDLEKGDKNRFRRINTMLEE